jgi:uncharacterized membrane protein
MFYKIEKNIGVFLRLAVISYLLMSIIILVASKVGRNFFDIALTKSNELVVQIVILLVIYSILIIFFRNLSIKLLSLIISSSILVYILVFILKAPAMSLIIGALFLGVPPLYFSIDSIFRNKGEDSKHLKILSIINISFYVLCVIIMLFSINGDFPTYSGNNITHITTTYELSEKLRIMLPLSIVFLVVMFLVFMFFKKEDNKHENKRLVKNIVILIVVGLVVYQVVMFSNIMIHRVKALGTGTYDFGLFTQMFYSMKNTGTMITTLERSIPLSHLAVHFSPIYYLYLPIFLIFPYPETLEALQVITVASAVVPIYLIAKHFNFSRYLTGFLIILYIFNPALIGSSFYDLHENCFLPVLLLFTIYFMLKQKLIPLLVFVLLTLLVKEDSSIYLVFIMLYFLFSHTSKFKDAKQKQNNVIYSILIIGLSVGYFLIVNWYLSTQGDGVMTWRYNNLNAYSDLGLLGVVISVFQNPSYLLATMFSPEKVCYFMISLFMMGLLPLFMKKLADYWLFVPFILFNFASTYPYQHQYGYQYYFGTTVLLLFMTMLVLHEKENDENTTFKLFKKAPILYLIATVILTALGTIYIQTKRVYIDIYQGNVEKYDSMKEFLTNIPSDKKILTSGYLTTYLADREVLYEYRFYKLSSNAVSFDYIIIDRRANQDYIDTFVAEALYYGYIESDLTNDYFIVFVPAEN